MNDMKRKVKESQVNNKLRAVLKGTHSQLDRIQIPTGDWYHSEKECEIFHYNHGVWEAYPRMPRYKTDQTKTRTSEIGVNFSPKYYLISN
jgi:hypothetical protein